MREPIIEHRAVIVGPSYRGSVDDLVKDIMDCEDELTCGPINIPRLRYVLELCLNLVDEESMRVNGESCDACGVVMRHHKKCPRVAITGHGSEVRQ
jgi:hypothetical protein